MKIDIRKLYGLKEINVDEDISIPQDYYTKMNVKTMTAHATGKIIVNYENNIEIDLNITGEFIMPCEITFEDVSIPFSTTIEEEILALDEQLGTVSDRSIKAKDTSVIVETDDEGLTTIKVNIDPEDNHLKLDEETGQLIFDGDFGEL